MNQQQNQPRMMNGQPQEMPPEYRRKIATCNLANEIFMTLVATGHAPGSTPTTPVDLVNKAFDLARAFDKRTKEELETPEIASGAGIQLT